MVMSKRKLQNSPFWVNNLTGQRVEKLSTKERAVGNWSYWHSELEWKVYQDLRLSFPAESIVRQSEIEVVPRSAQFPSVKWSVDFAVKVIEADCVVQWHYIEAKGEWVLADSIALTGFTRLLKTLAYHNPGIYSRLHLVGYSAFTLCEGIEVQHYKEIGRRIN